jgi:hypothetical protein
MNLNEDPTYQDALAKKQAEIEKRFKEHEEAMTLTTGEGRHDPFAPGEVSFHSGLPFTSYEEKRKERRRYALLQAAATLASGEVLITEARAAHVVTSAERLLAEIERREKP